MELGTRIALVALALVFAAPAAIAESLDDVPHTTGVSLYVADPSGETESLPASRDTSSLDEVPVVPPTARIVPTRTTPLDEVPAGDSRSLEAAERAPGWRAPSCESLSLELGAAPRPGDMAGWESRLRAAQQELGASKRNLHAANAAYSRSITSDEPRGQARADIIETRDRARNSYSRARCALPVWVERARRAGVPDVLVSSYSGEQS